MLDRAGTICLFKCWALFQALYLGCHQISAVIHSVETLMKHRESKALAQGRTPSTSGFTPRQLGHRGWVYHPLCEASLSFDGQNYFLNTNLFLTWAKVRRPALEAWFPLNSCLICKSLNLSDPQYHHL